MWSLVVRVIVALFSHDCQPATLSTLSTLWPFSFNTSVNNGHQPLTLTSKSSHSHSLLSTLLCTTSTTHSHWRPRACVIARNEEGCDLACGNLVGVRLSCAGVLQNEIEIKMRSRQDCGLCPHHTHSDAHDLCCVTLALIYKICVHITLTLTRMICVASHSLWSTRFVFTSHSLWRAWSVPTYAYHPQGEGLVPGTPPTIQQI